MDVSRRSLLAGATGSAWAFASSAHAQTDHPALPQLTHLCDLHFELTEPLRLPSGPFGDRTILRVAGGRVDGPKLQGKILPGFGDWAVMRADGIFDVDIRAALQMDDGAIITVSYRGLLRMAPELWRSYLQGNQIDPNNYYFRVTPRFETGADAYRWLNGIVCLGVGFDLPPTPRYRIYEVT